MPVENVMWVEIIEEKSKGVQTHGSALQEALSSMTCVLLVLLAVEKLYKFTYLRKVRTPIGHCGGRSYPSRVHLVRTILRTLNHDGHGTHNNSRPRCKDLYVIEKSSARRLTT